MTRVLVTGARAPVTLDLARAFRAAGCDVTLADSVRPFAAMLARPRFRIELVPPPRHAFAAFRARLRALADSVDAVVPTCEEVFWLAAAAERDRWSEKLFAPSSAMLRTLHSKAEFPTFACRAGVDAPRTIAIASVGEIDGVDIAPTERVLKPEFSRFGTHTLIAPSPSAVRALRIPPTRRWVVQERVVGDELCVWSVVRGGTLTACVVYRPVLRHRRAASYAFESVDAPAVVEMARRIGAAVGGDGQLSYDVIVTRDRRVVPLECNPRAVSGLHLADATPALADAILGRGALPAVPPGTVRYLAPAMAILGLPNVALGASFDALRSVWRAGNDAVGRPGDRLPVAGVLLDAARFAFTGIQQRRSASEQTTADIEWDGEPFP